MGHLILEEIPIYDDGGSTANDVKDVTAVQIEMKAVSKVKYQLFLFLVQKGPLNNKMLLSETLGRSNPC